MENGQGYLSLPKMLQYQAVTDSVEDVVELLLAI